MTQATKERTTATFTVKEYLAGEPFIMVELYAPGLKALQDGFLSLELREGMSMEQANALADMLNAHVGELSHTRLGG